jgi:hypothetical protein
MTFDPSSRPKWDFFHDASIASLQSFELSRLNSAANLRRQVAALLDQWIDDNSQALLARWVREQRALRPAPERTVDLELGAACESLLPDTSHDAALPPDRPAQLALLPRRAEHAQRPRKLSRRRLS